MLPDRVYLSLMIPHKCFRSTFWRVLCLFLPTFAYISCFLTLFSRFFAVNSLECPVTTFRKFFDTVHMFARGFSYSRLKLQLHTQYSTYTIHGLAGLMFLSVFYLEIRIHFQGYHSSESATLSLFGEGKSLLIFYSCVLWVDD